METLRHSHYRFWIVATTLAVWWFYASMVLCSAFDSFGQNGATHVAYDTVMPQMQGMLHQHGNHQVAADLSSTADLMDDIDSSSIEAHCSGQKRHDSMSAHGQQLCCDELQDGSASGQSAPSLFLAVFLTWAVTVVEPLTPLFSVFSQSAVLLYPPPIYLLVCSFLK